MKKLAGILLTAGIILAMCTAGGMDRGVIETKQIILQALISIALMFAGCKILKEEM
jgi:hypothetical protein